MVRTKVFICYSHKDTKYLERLQVHFRPLERAGMDLWDDTRIRSGQHWKEEIKKALAEARVAILLLSADFFGSDFIHNDELPSLLAAEEEDGLVILPLLIKPCGFSKDSRLSHIQAVNPDLKPLIGMGANSREALFVKLTERVEQILKSPPS